MEMSVRDIGLMYDEQFNRKMKIVKFLLKHLMDKKEVQLAKKWLIRVSNIKSPVLEVKKNRNAFLSYMIKVLRDAVLEDCLDLEPNTVCDPLNSLAFLDYPEQLSDSSIDEIEAEEDAAAKRRKHEFYSKWSSDHKTYVAIKSMPGRGTLMYMAISKKPGLESWRLPLTKNSDSFKKQ